MRNRLWKRLASAMAGLMVVSSVQAAVLPVMAQDGAAGTEISGKTADGRGTVSGGAAQEKSEPEGVTREDTRPDDGIPEETRPDDGMTEKTRPESGMTEKTRPESGMTEKTRPESGMTEKTRPDGAAKENTMPDSGLQGAGTLDLTVSGNGNMLIDMGNKALWSMNSGRDVTENILADFNTGFEGASAEGNLYWWNNSEWNQSTIPRIAYENAEQPDSSCGNYYVQVNPAADGKANCQINGDNIAELIRGGVTYEYSYYAKLAEGQASGEVTLNVVGNYSNYAQVTVDQQAALTEDAWQKVTGTFLLDKDESPVMIQFAGSSGLSYCLDELRVAPVKDTPEENQGANLIQNPNFEGPDLSSWSIGQGGAEISSGDSAEPVFEEITTYGIIRNRKNSSDCFAQDVTAVVKNNTEYEFSFWAKLSEDYAGAPAGQRVVEFAPYLTADGKTTYYGSYSTELSGTTSQSLEPGVWTKYSGVFKVAYTGSLEQVVIRLLEQGTNYGQGDCVKGEYYVTGVELKEKENKKAQIQWDVPDLKDSIGGALNARTGAAVMNSELSDGAVMDLVTKHFDAVTPGNELKPDAIFGYSNNVCPGTQEAELNGVAITVPKLDFSRAETMLDWILAWNKEHPENLISMRGHVLVWHSQTPEWFFHENYDASAPYVSKEVMNQRLEWYIKSVLEHFTGGASPYKDLFYGWDVVNEAVSDGTGTYRTDQENSSWWAVYQSNEYVINAFRYANRYAPADLELYYNDYNECVPVKREGIVKLLRDVKNAEGTRITAMGMQGHYNMNSPTIEQFEAAAQAYGAVVGKIQITELDLKASSEYDGTEAARAEEYTRQAYRYKAIFDALRRVEKRGDADVTAVIIWGVVDKNSWLHNQTGIGGGNTGTQKQCPLLFDDDYQVKPSYWAFVDPSKLEPFTQGITALQTENFGPCPVVAFAGQKADFRVRWDDQGLYVNVLVKDEAVDPEDCVSVYVDRDNSKKEGSFQPVQVLRRDAQEAEGGYTAIVKVPMAGLAAGEKIGFDVQVTDKAQVSSWNDQTNNQAASSKYYGELTMKPYGEIPKGTAVIDGALEAAWEKLEPVELTIRTGDTQASARGRWMWDENALYVLMEVKDSVLNNASQEAHQQDSIEVFIDENNHKSDSYEEDDKQYRISFANGHSFNGPECREENITSAVTLTQDGYLVEAAFKWTQQMPVEGMSIGVDLQINDASEAGVRAGTLNWYDESGMGWSSPGVFGTAVLTKAQDTDGGDDNGGSGDNNGNGDENGGNGDDNGNGNENGGNGDNNGNGDENAGNGDDNGNGDENAGNGNDNENGGQADQRAQQVAAVLEALRQVISGSGSQTEKLAAVEVSRESLWNQDWTGLKLGASETIQKLSEIEELWRSVLGTDVTVESESGMPQITLSNALLSIPAGKDGVLRVRAAAPDEASGIQAPQGSRYTNMVAAQITLMQEDNKIQAKVPVRLLLDLEGKVDLTQPFVVLHLQDGSLEEASVDYQVMDSSLEILTPGFSVFVVANVEKTQNGSGSEDQSGGNQEQSNSGEAANVSPAAANTVVKSPKTYDGTAGRGLWLPALATVAAGLALVCGAGAFIRYRNTKREK